MKDLVKEPFDGKTVALDLANGSASMIAKEIFESMGAQVIARHDEPNGTNINRECGSTHIEVLQALVYDTGADIGFAYDGDADRCLAVDDDGKVIDGDHILYLCGKYLKEQGKLKDDTVVTTVMSNMGLYKAFDKLGIHYEQTAVGDKYVCENMMANGYVIGGEQSGHIIFLDPNTTGDGILTAIQLLSVMKRTGKKASELAKAMEVMPQVLVNARVNNAKKNTYMEVPAIRHAISKLEEEFSADGRVLIRTSGTEPLIRVMIEGKDMERMEKAAKELAAFIEKTLQ